MLVRLLIRCLCCVALPRCYLTFPDTDESRETRTESSEGLSPGAERLTLELLRTRLNAG